MELNKSLSRDVTCFFYAGFNLFRSSQNISLHLPLSLSLKVKEKMNNQTIVAPIICSGCESEFTHSRFSTCDTCRVSFDEAMRLYYNWINLYYMSQERGRIRAANRRRNNEIPGRRGRSVQLPAAFISELGRLQPFDLGPMDKVCADCGAKHWEAELPSQCTSRNKFWMSCCKAGAVKLETLQSPPDSLKTLL